MRPDMGMVEKVAGAIEDALRGKEFLSYEDAARTAIEAMREPTEAMVGAALNTTLPEKGEPPLYEKVWLAMIAAALNEQEQG